MNISVIGLGKLGSSMVACIASRGYKVIGVDKNSEIVSLVNRGIAPVREIGLDTLLKVNKELISATQNCKEAVLDSEITFIIVPTPSQPNGAFSSKYVLKVCKDIGYALAKKDTFHTVVVTSTVMPGETGRSIKYTLEEYSNKICGKDFGLCYSPEFIALGSILRDFLNPDFILIGEHTEKAGQILENFYKDICLNNPQVVRMSLENAELTKIAVNVFLTIKISYINTLAEVCERIPNGDIERVASALALDSRIGKKLLKAGLGAGGPCLPRDQRAFIRVAKDLDARYNLPQVADQENDYQVTRLLGKILDNYTDKNSHIALLGLSYKPNTPVVDDSQAMWVAEKLMKLGLSVKAYDPMATDTAKKMLPDLTLCNSWIECVKNASMIVLATNWPEFHQISPADISKNATIIDCWRILNSEKFKNISKYIAFGIGPKK